MPINLLNKAEIRNSTDGSMTVSGTTLSRSQLQIIAGIKEGEIEISNNSYICFEAQIHYPFYCQKFVLFTDKSEGDLFFYFQPQQSEPWKSTAITIESDNHIADFGHVKPDLAQVMHKIKVSFSNVSGDSITISGAALYTSDYPIDFNYTSFSVVASSYANDPLLIENKSIQHMDQDIRVMPIFSDDFDVDQVFVITASGQNDTDAYHVNRGIKIPEDIPWNSGIFNGTKIVDRQLTISGSSTLSGTWTSPVIYVEDPNYISLYVYGDDTSDDAVVEKDWVSVNNLVDARGSNESPLPNFLIISWTKHLWTLSGDQDALPSVARSPRGLSSQKAPDPTDQYWYRYLPRLCGDSDLVDACPYIYGRSKRIYMKGDGTILANSIDNHYEIASRCYTVGIPFKIFGDINDYWNAAAFFGLLGRWSIVPELWPRGGNACYLGSAAYSNYNRFSYTTETDSSGWAYGRDISSQTMDQMYPHYLHDGAKRWALGCANEPIHYEYIGSTTIAMDNHPNEWIIIVATMFPATEGGNKFMNIYMFNIRNFWVSERILLGSFNMGVGPAEEGYAICKCKTTGGFWMHIGYRTNRIYKYTADGTRVGTYITKRGYNSIIETSDPTGLWMIKNDGVFYYEEVGDQLVFRFKVLNNNFEFLQMGGIDEANNLWLVDRDSSTVYRINYSSRSIDYENYIPWVVGVWPHPSDGSAFIYVGFDSDSASPAIKRVSVDDVYQYEDLITTVPAQPLSDTSGVQFKGRLANSYIIPSVNDPIWGTDDEITLDWQGYANASLTFPGGKYKQFRLTLQRSNDGVDPPVVRKVRMPLPMILRNVPFLDTKEIYINPHLRYNKEYGHYTTELVTWWPHEWRD